MCIVNYRFTLFLIDCCFKGYSNGLKFEKSIYMEKNTPRCLGYRAVVNFLGVGYQGVSTPSVWDTRVVQLPSIPDSPVSKIPGSCNSRCPGHCMGSHFLLFRLLSKLQAIATDFKTTTIKKY